MSGDAEKKGDEKAAFYIQQELNCKTQNGTFNL